MNKLLLSAALAASLLGSALAQDAANKDQAVPTKTDPAATTAANKTFADYQMGMAFDYPTNWTLVTDPAPKKKKGFDISSILKKKKRAQPTGARQSIEETLFYIPTGGHAANFELYSALFDQAPEEWEKVQSLAATNLKRTVVKQWREEILGVPLLLTKLSYDDAGGPVFTLSGLVYSRTPYKMQFVLTANTDDYDAAEYAVRQALQSLRTTSGNLPLPEDPNHPLDQSAYIHVVNKPPKVLVMTTVQPNANMAKKGEVVVSTTVADKKALLTMPTGWTADAAAADGTITLHNAGVTGGITISIASILDSDPPQAAILKASSLSLDQFDKVIHRDETSDDFSTAGASTDIIWREGSTTRGSLTSCEAYGATGELYWLLRYKLAGTASAAERKAVNDLIDGMSIDPAQ